VVGGPLVCQMHQVLSFGLYMNHVLKSFLEKFVVICFHDILVYSQSEEEHMGHLWEVLTVLQ